MRARPLLRRGAGLALTALVLYGAFPALVEVFDAWPQAKRIEPWWYAAMIALQAGSLWCLWRLQQLCMDAPRLGPVARSQLASGALGRVVPGGAAAAAAAQFAMLRRAGVPSAAIGTGLAVGTVLQIAALCALPLLTLPAIVIGLRVPDGLLPALLIGAGAFAAMFVLAAWVLRSDAALRGLARVIEWVSRRIRRGNLAARGRLAVRLLEQRDAVVRRLGAKWYRALAEAVGRWLLDFLCLLAALAAIGADVRISLVLLAYVGAQILAQIPVTPGGLGLVEAGLTASLAVAGASAGEAAVATLAYRLVSYWLLLPTGLVAWVIDRRRTSSAGMTPSVEHPPHG
jgi:uncharacterized protein (TIRG00374 family)